jgi:hypothetical protein
LRTGNIQQIINLFKEAFEHLNVDFQLSTLEEHAILVDKAMSAEGRIYHTMDHVFDLIRSTDPIITLAALFHDIVYYQVDDGILPEIKDLLAPQVIEDQDGIRLAKRGPSDDRSAKLACMIFGFTPGENLTASSRMNEFLSTLTANLCLKGVIPPQHLAAIDACIEASIPFRNKRGQREGSFDVLAGRLELANKVMKLNLGEDEIICIVQKAAGFANMDVHSFGEDDPARFLATTWKLLPETNHSLLSSEIYSIKDYRLAIQKMDQFFNSLDPEKVFNSYRGVPSEEEMGKMVQAAEDNIKTGGEYLDVQLATIAILEALAEATGGDGPLAMFMGSTYKGQGPMSLVGKEFSGVAPTVDKLHTSPVYQLLLTGGADDPNSDIRLTPLALFVYLKLGPARLRATLEKAAKFFNAEMDALEFLAAVDQDVISPIAQSCAEVVVTRRESLLEFT